jgi:H+-translocating NAD(P) transhydrogenase subunit alpha
MSRRLIQRLGAPLLVAALGLLAAFRAAPQTPAQRAAPPAAAAESVATPATDLGMPAAQDSAAAAQEPAAPVTHEVPKADYWPLLFVFTLATFIGLGIIRRVSRLLHTPLMSITNAISAIAVVGSIIVAGSDYPTKIRILGAIALFASMTNIVSGFLITDRMLKMFKTEPRKTEGGKP